MGEEDYREVASFIQGFVHRAKWVKGAEGLCLFGAAVLLLFALGLGVDQIKALFPYAPLVYSLLASTSVLILAVWTLYQCVRKISKEWAARTIEERFPALRNNLINSLQLYPRIAQGRNEPGLSVSMVLALLRGTRQQLKDIKIADLMNTRRLYAQVRLLGFLLVPVIGLVLFNPSFVGDSISLLIHPLKDLPLYETFIDVTPKGIRIVRGSAVTVQADTTGTIPKSLDLVWSSATADVEDNPNLEKILMEEQGKGKFSATITEVREDLRYQVETGPFASPWYTIEAVDLPVIGNVGATLYPPHYTGLATQTLQGGNIEGIKGSTLHLTARSTKELLKAKLLLEEGREVPLKVDGQKVQGNLVLFQSQKYQILVETPDGFRNSPIAYQLSALPDGFPTIDLRKPKEDIEVNGDETLGLEYSARDDYGIQEVTLVTKAQGNEERHPILKNGEEKFIPRERFQWDLARLGLRAGSEVTFHLEVLDNDTITGPKVGLSQALRLRLKDLKTEHKQVADTIRDLSNQMVDLLADHLEDPPTSGQEDLAQNKSASKSLDEKVGDLMQRIDKVLQRTRKDRLSNFATWSDLQSLKRNLEFTKDELINRKSEAFSMEEKGRLHDEISGELERMSMLAEDIGKRLSAQEVASSAQDLMKSQERLMDSLDKLKSGDKNLDAVLKEIANLARQLQSLQQSLTRFASRLPQEFMNSTGIRNLPFDNMLSSMNEIRKKLQEGDIKGAMELARELFNQLASMVAGLQNAQQTAMSSTVGRMQGEMMRSSSEMGRIVREQQQILVETEAIHKEQLMQQEESLKKDLDRFLETAEIELSRLAKLLPDMEMEEEREPGGESAGPPEQQMDMFRLNHLINNLRAQLRKKDFPALSKGMDMARDALRKAPGSIPEDRKQAAKTTLKQLLEGINALMEKPAIPSSDEDKKNLRDLAHRQGLLKEQTEELYQKLNSLFQLFPSLNPKIIRNIHEAANSMGKARGWLSQLDPEEAIPPEQDALERLFQSSRQMQSSMQRLAQRGQLGRIPLVYLFRRGRFLPSGRLVPLPGIPKFPKFDVKGGVTGLDTEKFQLPGKEDYKVPRKFREQIMESLKQGVPNRFKEQIESYFKALSQ